MGTPSQELIDEIKNKAGFTGDALQAARAISDGAAAALAHYGKVDIHVSVKIFRGGVWEVASIPLNIAKGDVTEKAIAKAIVGVASGIALGAAAAALTAGAPFIIGFPRSHALHGNAY